jgi:hypothetical protein
MREPRAVRRTRCIRKEIPNFFARFRDLERHVDMKAHLGHGHGVVQCEEAEPLEEPVSGNCDEVSDVDAEQIRAVSDTVDRVLQTWSKVGLATLMAEVRSVPAEKIIEVLEALEAAGGKALRDLLEL